VVVRNNRRTRLYHAAVAAATVTLMGTGWWLLTGNEGNPSILARMTGVPDTEIHRWTGWILAGLALVPLTIGIRATVTFVSETLRVDRGDGQWMRRWPVGATTGRFAPHRGHFDPGQRLANIAFVVALVTLVVTGAALTVLHGGPTFAWMVRVHRLATYVLTPLVIGHVLIAVGVLPGYRGARRAMGITGRVPDATIRRLWPGSTKEARSGITGRAPGTPPTRQARHPGDRPGDRRGDQHRGHGSASRLRSS
jgi:formate dehydrogenase subunit gamma